MDKNEGTELINERQEKEKDVWEEKQKWRERSKGRVKRKRKTWEKRRHEGCEER